MKKAVMYGAGNIGRGFIGKMFSDSGYSVTFIDIDPRIIDALQCDGRYPVGIVTNEGIRDEIVENVTGVNGAKIEDVAREIADADIMATALGVNALKYVAPHLAAGISLRIENKKPLNILLCENLFEADKYIKNLVLQHLPIEQRTQLDKYIGFVETSVGRMVPALEKPDNILRVNVEPYCFLPVDKDAFVGGVPELNGLYPYSPFSLFVERKLYMHNMGHSITAYLGAIKSYTYIYEAIGDGDILYIVYAALARSALALSLEHDIPVSILLDHASNLLYRFGNEGLKDTVARVGRDTVRKLSPSDRLSGAVKLLSKHGISASYHLLGIAAALHFSGTDDANSAAVFRDTEENGVKYALEKYSEMSENIDVIEGFYDQIRKGQPLKELIKSAMRQENLRPVV